MKKTLNDLRKVRLEILDLKTSLDAHMDEPDADVDVLSAALDELDKAYDALCEASEILDP
jgi:hypothetical protein